MIVIPTRWPSICLLVLLPAIAGAQSFGGQSMPEPTRLAVAASDPDASVVRIGTAGRIERNGESIAVGAIDVSVSGQTERGIELTLTSGRRSDALYLDMGQVAQLREELLGLEALHASACAGRGNCTFGIERCGPAQQSGQAYCPAVYHARDGETGLGISTPGNNFRFPSVTAAALEGVIQAIILESSESGASD